VAGQERGRYDGAGVAQSFGEIANLERRAGEPVQDQNSRLTQSETPTTQVS
jgi:hypothetical protein